MLLTLFLIKSCFFLIQADIVSIKSEYSGSLLEKTKLQRRRPFEELLPNAPSDALDLVNKLLQFNPAKRLSAQECLRHPYLAKFSEPEKEIELIYDVVPPVNDDTQLTVQEYRAR